MPTFTDFVSNPLLLILLLPMVTVLLCYGIPKLWVLNKVFLKKFDYYWIALSALGIIGLANKNGEFFKEIELTENKFFAELEFQNVQRSLDSSKHCFKFIGGPGSPPNFESIQKTQDSMCRWANYAMKVALTAKSSNARIKLKIPEFKDKVIAQDLKIIRQTINEYNKYSAKSTEQNPQGLLKNLSLFLQILSPLILVIGLSIRLTKTYLEIKLEKRPS